MSKQPNAVSDDAIIEAVKQAAATEQRDLFEGGVTKVQIAKHCELQPESLEKRLADLRDAGHVRQVDGVDPETHTPRKSWLPADG